MLRPLFLSSTLLFTIAASSVSALAVNITERFNGISVSFDGSFVTDPSDFGATIDIDPAIIVFSDTNNFASYSGSVDFYRADWQTPIDLFNANPPLVVADPSARTGDGFGFSLLTGQTGSISLPGSYVSGTEISGTTFFAGADFDDLGVVQTGTFIFTIPNTTNSLTVTISAIPVPASLPLLASALGLAGLGLRRTKRHKAPEAVA